jgi:hypothetical protein
MHLCIVSDRLSDDDCCVTVFQFQIGRQLYLAVMLSLSLFLSPFQAVKRMRQLSRTACQACLKWWILRGLVLKGHGCGSKSADGYSYVAAS